MTVTFSKPKIRGDMVFKDSLARFGSLTDLMGAMWLCISHGL
jgi:hypothetical protein